jgi:dienelactone hydrolase
MKQRDGVEAVVLYNTGPGEVAAPVAVLAHMPGGADGILQREGADVVVYPGTEDFFAVPEHANYDRAAAKLARARTLSFLKPLLGGPMDEVPGVLGHPVLGRGWFPNMKTTLQAV